MENDNIIMKKLVSEYLQRKFYEQQLQIPEQNPPQKPKQIQKIVQRRDNKFLVKWVGLPAQYNSWVDYDFVMNPQRMTTGRKVEKCVDDNGDGIFQGYK